MLAAATGFFATFVLIFMRVPIAIALGVVGLVGFGWIVGWNQAGVMLALTTRSSTMTYGMVVIPLFVLMGNFVAGAGISRELFRAAQNYFGHRRGGLALATVVSSGGFAAVCGSSVATVITIGRVALPSMRSYKYDDSLSTGAIAAGATLGVMIPPSIILVIYGIITDSHIGKLYAAGLLPGLVGIIGYAGAVMWTVRRRPDSAPAAEKVSRAERLSSLKEVWAIGALFALVLGGIYAGWFTAAEASGIGAFGAFALALFKRRLTWTSLQEILVDSAITSTLLITLLIGASMFTEFLNYTNAHRLILNFVQNSGFAPVQVVIVIALIYIFLGMIMETMSMILLTVPIFFPIVTGLGYDPVWFGILVVVLCELGLITPPIGVNLFIMRAVAPDIGIGTVIRGIIPFIVADIFRVALIIFVPGLSLLLPNLWF